MIEGQFCVACGVRPAKHTATRTNMSSGEEIKRTDQVCDKCITVYKKWHKEGRFIQLTIDGEEQEQ